MVDLTDHTGEKEDTMENLEYIYCLLQGINKYTLSMDYVDFGSFFCMCAEDYCKVHQKDVREFMDEMTAMVHTINDEEGAY